MSYTIKALMECACHSTHIMFNESVNEQNIQHRTLLQFVYQKLFSGKCINVYTACTFAYFIACPPPAPPPPPSPSA